MDQIEGGIEDRLKIVSEDEDDDGMGEGRMVVVDGRRRMGSNIGRTGELGHRASGIPQGLTSGREGWGEIGG